MPLHFEKLGAGRPLLLIHGIGGTWRSWEPLLPALTAERTVIAIDLPGHGQSPALDGKHTIRALTSAVTEFLVQHNLLGIDAVGSSMGARLVLELARRGAAAGQPIIGAGVALDPGGFWKGVEIPFFYHSVSLSERLIRLLQPLLPALTSNVVSRSVLLAQFSARPWQLPAGVALTELRSFGTTPVFQELLDELAHGEEQEGAPAGSIPAPLVIGWGRNDRVTLPGQAAEAEARFPDAQLYWFDHCGHFPAWDQPAEAGRLILAAVGRRPLPKSAPPRDTSGAMGPAVGIAAAAVLAVGAWWLMRGTAA